MQAIAKRQVSFADLEAQTAFELPAREMLLVTIVITNLLNNISIPIEIKNNNVAVQVCAVVNALNSTLLTSLTCDVQQT